MCPANHSPRSSSPACHSIRPPTRSRRPAATTSATAGGSPFNELTLPDALIKFRQGIGRLIRTATDRGMITILDTRVLAKSYGRLFLDCLPQPEFTLITRETRPDEFRPFA
jgi:ATP-dependent DNA helicase DinG